MVWREVVERLPEPKGQKFFADVRRKSNLLIALWRRHGKLASRCEGCDYYVVKAPKMPCPVCGSLMNVSIDHIYSSDICGEELVAGEEVVAVCPYCGWEELLETIYDYAE